MNRPFFKLNEENLTFQLQYKHSGTFANCKCEELSNPKNLKMCDPILVTLLKMQPYYRQSSRENVTSSSGTSPLASCKEVPPPPNPEVSIVWLSEHLFCLISYKSFLFKLLFFLYSIEFQETPLSPLLSSRSPEVKS